MSNAEVLAKVGQSPVRFLLLKRQLFLYGQVVRLPEYDMLRVSPLVRKGVASF